MNSIQRLKELIEFAQQSALLRSNPVSDISNHRIFFEYEHNIANLPGLHFDVSKDGENEIWLVIERLQESSVPQPESALLGVWIELTNNPNKEPALRDNIELQKLLNIGAILLPKEKKNFDPNQLISLNSFEQKKSVDDQLKAYIANVWKPWAAEERLRRESISLYAKLFTLKQQLEGGIVDAQLELVWGAGMVVWKMAGIQVLYPLITKLVELTLNESTMAIEVRPRDIDARFEIDIYSAADNPGVPELERAGKEFFSKATTTFSPFDRGTFEPLLRSAVAYLDPKGTYWPEQSKAEIRTLPKPTEELKITDTWVLFARPRSASLFIQDLDRFKKKLESNDLISKLPKAVEALVIDPATTNEEILLPSFRGISMVYGNGASNLSGEHPFQDLFFPMPFNDEQVRIVQLMECFDGVVVQGPPGTGKTHTIANVICHYLALGKRVLVTSMKDPALAVLQEKLPEEIRSLAISLLTSEQEGMKQFEYAVSKIASEVQRLDRVSLSREISQFESTIDALHGKLAKTDNQISEWALKNLRHIDLDGELIEPQEAAELVTLNCNALSWFKDLISIGQEFCPKFTDLDIIELREARRVLGEDLDYYNCKLPLIAAFPDSRELLRAHQDLTHLQELQAKVNSGEVPLFADTSKETFEAAQHLFAQISNLKLLSEEIKNAGATWTTALQARLRNSSKDEILELFDLLGKEIEAAIAERKHFLSKPVTVPNHIDSSSELVEAINNMAKGKRPFGLRGVLGKSVEKRALESIRIVNSVPNEIADWQYVAGFVSHLKRLKEIIIRWNALADELNLPILQVEPSKIIEANDAYSLYRKLVDFVFMEREIRSLIKAVLPTFKIDSINVDDIILDEVERVLKQHFTRNRLAETWVLKERFQQVITGCTGRISDKIRNFLENMLGNPAVSDGEMQGSWTILMEELRRVQGLKTQIDIVSTVSSLIENSGAPILASQLRSEVVTKAGDILLPTNWKELWRLKRLSTYLGTIDGRTELKKLAKIRSEIESDLALIYNKVITKRTWLRLSENATPEVRSALMAYLSAIQRIGKGSKGAKRAIRYRQDARIAATKATPAIPCWIMPHYRISESLPAEFGSFDLVVIDEASQSDLSALPAILRGNKILIVGDDKQVSPEGVGIEEEKLRNLITRFLTNQVETYRSQMTPERSIYDLFKVVFAKSAVMLKEHFRCVAPILEYSKREFYNHELKPLRLPKKSERLDPPLIDVIVEDGFRKGDLNMAEVRFIIDEIKAIVKDEQMAKRSIGVVSLLGDKQALKIWELLEDEIGIDVIRKHKIACGDARTFQGKERDVMFLSMVVSRGNATALSRETFAQRFNVAASRARDRMYLVRSIRADDLSEGDKLRRSLIAHFTNPFAKDEKRVNNLRELCESPFERDMYDILTERGYHVTPQVPVGEFRIDMVIEGHQDNRLAVECDGDRFHGVDRWEDDMRRQRILERAGWHFWRCFASTFVLHKHEVIEDLLQTLKARGIEPIGSLDSSNSMHVEQRKFSAFRLDENGGSQRDM